MKNTITMIGTLPPIKGLSPYCKELAMALSKKIKIEFIGFRELYPESFYPGGTKIDSDHVTIKSITNQKDILSWYNPFSWIKVGLIAQGNIVHAQWWSYILAPIYFVFLLIFKIRDKKIVLTLHNVFPHERNWISNLFNKVIFHFGDHFIVHTSSNKQKIISEFNIPLENISIIPHGILKPYRIRGISRSEARKRLNIPLDKKILLFFGNIRPYKGLDILLEAFSLIKQKKPDTILIIAGEPWFDWNRYDVIIKENDLEDSIIKHLQFIPNSEVEYYFKCADIVVLPYIQFDSQSGVGAIALAFKKPLIISDVGGLKDFVKDKKAISKPNDSEDLSRKIIKALEDEKLLKRLSKDSSDLAERYSWSNIAKKTIQIYQKVSK